MSPLKSDVQLGASNSVSNNGQPSIVFNSEAAYDPSSEPVFDNIETEHFVRRHSLCLRTPHKGSLAEDIIQSSRRASLDTRRSILDDLRGLSEQLSDFASDRHFTSCNESPLSSSSSDEAKNSESDEAKPIIQSKKTKKNKKKRRASKTPPKEFFLQKKSKEA